MVTDTEHGGIFELLELAHRRRNPSTRFYSNTARNDQARYRALVRWAESDQGVKPSDWHRITHGQLAGRVYGVEPTAAEGKKKSESNRASLNRLASAGLIEWRVALSSAGESTTRGRSTTGGQSIALEFRLLPVPERPGSVFSGAPAGVAQSVRAAES